jgi:hypothetical protein
MKEKGNVSQEIFEKQYTVTIATTVPIPFHPEERVKLVMSKITPVINQIVADAMTVAIGTWPTPENPVKTK